MPDCRCAFEYVFQNLFIPKNIRHEANTFVDVEAIAPLVGQIFTGDDASSFLASMLEGVQPVVRHHGSSGMVENTEDPAMTSGLSFTLGE